jgi:porphobilinogen synthase
MNLMERPRRLRKNAAIRDLVKETELRPRYFIWPVFVVSGSNIQSEISSMPGCFHYSADKLLRNLPKLIQLGLRGVALFPAVAETLKNSKASECYNPEGLIPETVRLIKKNFPELVVVTDVALDPYSSDGHDGLVKNGEVLNDETLLVLAKQAIVQAEAGADFVGPSDMMDGRVGWIRRALDENGHYGVGVISYTAKYASAFYGPFREALQSAPKSGDKKTYQMNPANRREALREARLDRQEGADILMVKPALAYLDVIRALAARSDRPIAAYNVSGEYAMVKAAAKMGWLDEKQATLEILLSLRRAGADMIFSYHTPDVLEWLQKN